MDIKSLSHKDIGDDFMASSVKGQHRKKIQRNTTERQTSPWKQNHAATKARPMAEQKPTATPKRKSIMKDPRQPQGPRTFGYSPVKRNSVDASTLLANSRTQLPTTSSGSFHGSHDSGSRGLTNASINDLGRVEETEASMEFLPPINFDEFHSSLTTNDLKLKEYPMSGLSSNIHASALSQAYYDDMASNNQWADDNVNESAGKKPHSLLRRLSNASRHASKPQERALPAAARSRPPQSRSRPQDPSQLSARSENSSRTPRKSVGPGLIVNTAAAWENRQADTLGQGLDDVNTRPMRSASIERKDRRRSEAPGLGLSNATGRPNKNGPNRKSLWVSSRSRSPLVSLNTQSLTPDYNDLSVDRSLPSPGMGSGNKSLIPPTSSGRRQSVIAPYVSGLGARTISPTDARRLKRLSLLPGPPPLPQSPTTPQQPKSAEHRSTTHSPASSSFGKSLTPLSALETPDGSGKSLVSRPSLSSNSSVNSVRALSSASQPRLSQVLSSSRIPTPKPKPIQTLLESSDNDGDEQRDEEEVPPVPAIPKAYESPKDLISQRSSEAMAGRYHDYKSQSFLKEPVLSPTAVLKSGERVDEVDENTNSGSMGKKYRRGLTTIKGADSDAPAVIQPGVRKSLQPLRLPPLNLLPLGTPTATRVSSFRTPTTELEQRELTPPQGRRFVKTPSTPMTASKATFFPRSFGDEPAAQKAGRMRSSSSQFTLRSDPMSLYNTPATAMMTPISTPIIAERQAATTPFASTSLPKDEAGTEEFHETEEVLSPQSATIADAANLFGGFRVESGRCKDNLKSSATWSSTEPEVPTTGTSLRRKLSLSWRRGSSSKASSRNGQRLEDESHTHQKQTEMPPPRLPASATINGRSGMSPGHSAYQPAQTSRRRKSSLLLNSHTPLSERFTNRIQQDSQNGNPPPYRDLASSSERIGASSNGRKVLLRKDLAGASKGRPVEISVDHEDLMADEDMKRLALKRRDFETAAKELDELRAKTKPKEKGSAYQALQMVNLNIYERGEIIEYKEIYFCGTRGAKKYIGDLNASQANFGYDDERGDYNIVLGDHLSYRYEVLDVLGKGSFGQVVRCIDHKTGGLVAIKIIRNKKRFHQQALVEVNILKLLREWDPESRFSMVNFTHSFYFRGHLCISTELLGMNLYEFIKAHDFKGFPLRLIRRFTKQILSSLCLLKSRRVIHCDLKPENILLAHPLRSEIKVIDFGSSCFENEKVYTYIQSRFYRSPEVILGMTYGLPIDMWSMGCILAELLTGYPIFPGENEQEQLSCVMEIFGPPEKHLIEKSTRRKLFFDSLGKPRVTVSSKGRRRRPSSKTLQQALRCDDEAFLDFISRCLRWDPERRLKPEEALNHEFITGVKKVPSSTLSRPRQQPQQQQRQMNGSTQGNISPIKRMNSTNTQTPGRSRPLPEPPATSFKSGNGIGVGNGLGINGGGNIAGSNSRLPHSSPIKAGTSRRHSTIDGLQTSNYGVKKLGGIGVGSTTSSNLPRAAGGVVPRSVSGKPDLASSAAALASIRSR